MTSPRRVVISGIACALILNAGENSRSQMAMDTRVPNTGIDASVRYANINSTSRAMPSEVRYQYWQSGALPSEVKMNYAAIGPNAPGGPSAYIPPPVNRTPADVAPPPMPAPFVPPLTQAPLSTDPAAGSVRYGSANVSAQPLNTQVSNGPISGSVRYGG